MKLSVCLIGRRWRGGVALAGVLLCSVAAQGQSQAPVAQSIGFSSCEAFRSVPCTPRWSRKHCVTCHNDKTRTAGLSLQNSAPHRCCRTRRDLGESAAEGRVGRNAAVHGADPSGARRSAGFAAFLETTLDRAALAKPNPGRAPVHRLNRAEYSNAIRDLLAVDVKPGEWLPVDDSGYGFDNIAAVLSTSPALLERYMSAARRISRLAIGDLTLKPVEEIYDAKRDPLKGARNERLSDDLPFDSRAGISVQHYFPVDARIRVQDSHSRACRRPATSRRSIPTRCACR